MITIEDVVLGRSEYSLWHGTRADFGEKIILGADALGSAKDIIRDVWSVICKSSNVSLEEIQSDDVMNYFSQPDSKGRATHIGNSIRFLNKNFTYSVIAFAFNRFTARGFAEEGSELANAILALTESALLEYPHEFNNELLLEKIREAQKAATKIASGKGKILRLKKIPTHGFFCSPDNLDKEVNFLSREPFPERILFSELFFTESIPLDYFDIEEI